MLRLVGRLGDGWIPSATRIPPDALDAAGAQVDAAARAAGRDPASVRRLYNVPAPPPDQVRGQTAAWAADLAGIALRHGVTGFLVFTDDRETVSRLAGDVVPLVRRATA